MKSILNLLLGKECLAVGFLILLANCLNSQALKKENEEILEKYSYFLVGIKTIDGSKKIYPLGTCFFVRREKELFFITTKHNINGYNTFNKMLTPSQYDTIGFRYFNSKTNQISFSSLDIIPIKKQLPNNYFYESPDLVVLQMRDTAIEQYINSLESYIIDNKQDNDILDSVIAIGYAFEDPNTISSTTLPTYYKGITADVWHKDPFYPPNDSLYYIVQPKTIQGMSGSPVFLKYRSKDKKNKEEHILFGGVLFGTNVKFNSTYIVSPDIVILQLIKFGSPKK